MDIRYAAAVRQVHPRGPILKSTIQVVMTDEISHPLCQKPYSTPSLDRNVAKRSYITPKLFIVISFFFFPLIDNLIKFCYKQRMSHQLKNLSLLLTINEYCMFHIEGFFSPTTFSLLYFIVVISTQIELNCWAWSRIQENLM